MSNPIFSSFNNNKSPQNSPYSGILNQIKNAGNPQEAAQQMLSRKPEVMNYINQNGGDARTAFYNMAAQMGKNPNDIINKLKEIFP